MKKLFVAITLIVLIAIMGGCKGGSSKANPLTLDEAKEFVTSKGYTVKVPGNFDTVIEGVDIMGCRNIKTNSISYLILKDGENPQILIDYIEDMTGKDQWQVNKDNYKEYTYKYEKSAFKLGAVKDSKYAIWMELGDGGIQDKDEIIKKFNFKK